MISMDENGNKFSLKAVLAKYHRDNYFCSEQTCALI